MGGDVVEFKIGVIYRWVPLRAELERVAAEGIMKGFFNYLGTSDGIFQGFEKLNLLWSSLVVLVIFPCKGPPILIPLWQVYFLPTMRCDTAADHCSSSTCLLMFSINSRFPEGDVLKVSSH